MTDDVRVTWLEYASTPLSYNVLMAAHWRRNQQHKRRWQRILADLLQAAGAPPVRRVEATATLRFPVRRRRDEGNYRTPLEKPLGDALVQVGVLPDDTPEFFTFTRLVFEDAPGPARTLLRLECWPVTDGVVPPELRGQGAMFPAPPPSQRWKSEAVTTTKGSHA